MPEKNLEKNVNEQSDTDQIWTISGIIVHKKRLNLVSIHTTDLILDVLSWGRDLALGQERLAEGASTADLKRMFEADAKILRSWVEGDDEHRGLKTRQLATVEPYLAARAARGYLEVRPSNVLDFVDDVIRRAMPAVKGDALDFVFLADPAAPEIHAVEASDFLVRYAAPDMVAQVWSQLDFDALCLHAIRKFAAPVATSDTGLNQLTPEDIFNRGVLQGLFSGVMPAGVQVEARERHTSNPKRAPKKRQ